VDAATIKFGFDGVEVEQGLNRVSKKTAAFSKQLSAAGSGGGINLGGASAQLQDIAVQLQGGTSAITVFTQQGSQLASMLGPQGALVGGLLAVGGAALSVGSNSVEAFDALMTSAAGAHTEVSKLSGADGLSAVADGLEKIQKQRAALLADSKGGFLGAAATELGRLFGGDDQATKREKRAKADESLSQDEVRLEKEILAASKDQLRLTQLRASGKEAEADELERQLKLRQQLKEIDALPVQPQTKDALKADAIAADKALGNPAAAAQQKEDLAELEAGLARIKTARDKLTEQRNSGLEGGALLTNLQQQQKELQNNAVLGGFSVEKDIDKQVSERTAQKDFSGAEKILKARADYEALQKQIDDVTEAMKRQAVQSAQANAKTAADATKRTQDEQKKEQQAQQRQLQDNLQRAKRGAEQQAAIQVKELKAAGRDKEAAELEKGLKLQSRRSELTQLGFTPQQAGELAVRELAAEDKLDRKGERTEGGRRKIKGGVSKSTFDGLGGFYALQQRNADGSRVVPLGQAFQRQNQANARNQSSRENRLLPEGPNILQTLQAIEKHLSAVA